jgi:predicted lipid carrier protein YhbT
MGLMSHEHVERDGPATQAMRVPLPLFLLQPLLSGIVHRVTSRHPELLQRLGPHRTSSFVIDPIDLPFQLHLKLDPANLLFRAYRRSETPPHDARIAASFLDLLRLVDCGRDGDAMFFSRDLAISGNTEAVVSLRNAIDDVDGSVAESAADMFGPPGRVVLYLLRRLASSRADAESQTL